MKSTPTHFSENSLVYKKYLEAWSVAVVALAALKMQIWRRSSATTSAPWSPRSRFWSGSGLVHQRARDSGWTWREHRMRHSGGTRQHEGTLNEGQT